MPETKKQTLSLKNPFSVGMRPKKTYTVIKESIFNKPEVKKTKTFIEKCIFNSAETKSKDFIVSIRSLKTI